MSASSVTETDQTFQFPDGTVIEYTVSTTDAAVRKLVATDLAKRLNDAQTMFPVSERDLSLAAYTAFVPTEQADAHTSTTTHALPEGELTVAIDASDERVHGYLHYLVVAAVAYAHVVNIDSTRASLLAAALGSAGVVLAVLGQVLLSVLVFGAGGVVALHVLVYYLAVRGVVAFHRQPTPVGEHH